MKTLSRLAQAALFVGIAFVACQLGSYRARSRVEFRDDDVSHEFQRGNANDDSRLDLSDAVFLLRFLFAGGEKPPCPAAGDTDDNGELELADAVRVLEHLFRGGPPPAAPFPEPGIDPTPDLGCREPPLEPLPPPGSLGGPDRELSPEEALRWRRGRRFFVRPAGVRDGLGPFFNGDSCRGCHLDPVVGGAGGLDVDVVRFARVDAAGTVSQLVGGPASSRLSVLPFPRDEVHPEANVMETRQTPAVLGLGLVDRIPEEAILANADPDDLDGDDISGRPRFVGGRLGRFGHKQGVPSLRDFAADALSGELGLTADPALSLFAGISDADAVPDPEVGEEDFLDLVFFVSHLAPPPRRIPETPARRARVEEGERLFAELGCARCHVPELEGPDGPVRAYSDFLLHDVADPGRWQVNEPGVEPREFRTPPLWGVRDMAPYLHDGSAETLEDAVLEGHFGEAAAAREAFAGLDFDAREKVEEFLSSL